MKLSIVTICRNNAAGLRATLESTLGAQPGFDDWEQIVVDGASTDGGFAEVDRYRGDPRLGWCVSEPDKGIYNAMNKGVAHARGDYLLFLNSGDSLLPNILARVFTEPWNADIAYGTLVVFGQGPERIWEYPPPEEIVPAYFLFGSLPHPASFISRRLLDRLGGYDESFRIVSDAKFFLDAVRDGARLHRIPVPISRFSFGGASTSSDSRELLNRERVRFLSPVFGKDLVVRAATIPDADSFLDEGTRATLQLDPSFRPFLKNVVRAARVFYLDKPEHAVPEDAKHPTGPDDVRLATEFLDAAAALRGHPRLALFCRHALHWIAKRLRRPS